MEQEDLQEMTEQEKWAAELKKWAAKSIDQIMVDNTGAWGSGEEAVDVSTFIEMARLDKDLLRSPHGYVFDAIDSMGQDPEARGDSAPYTAFDGILGAEEVVAAIMRHLRRADDGGTEASRAIVLAGPPGTPTREILDRLVTVVVEYSHSAEGRLYRIQGCPVNENPIHLVELDLRRLVFGDQVAWDRSELCNHCAERWHQYREQEEVQPGLMGSDGTQHPGRRTNMQVERFVLSAPNGVGIGQLHGDATSIQEVERAIGNARRGLLAISHFAGMSQSLASTVLRFAAGQDPGAAGINTLVIADAVIEAMEKRSIEHGFVNEVGRMLLLRLRHSLNLVEEEAIYQQYIADEMRFFVNERDAEEGSEYPPVHVAPLALNMAARLAVLSRLRDPSTLKVSNGRYGKVALYAEAATDPATIREMAACPDEGHFGISAGAVLNKIDECASLPNLDCVSPTLLLEKLSEIPEVQGEDVHVIAQDYAERVDLTVRQAAVDGYEDNALKMLEDYKKYVGVTPIGPGEPGIIGQNSEAELRRMEDHVGLRRDRERQEFRDSVTRFFAANPDASFTEHSQLLAGIDSRVLNPKNKVQGFLREPDEEAGNYDTWRTLRLATHNRLKRLYGYCDACAVDLVEIMLTVSVIVKVRHEGRLDWQRPLRFDLRDAEEYLTKFAGSAHGTATAPSTAGQG